MTAPARISWHGQEMARVTEIVKIGIGRRGPSVETTVEVPAFDEPELRQVVAMAKAIHLFDVAARRAPDSFLLMVAGLYNKHGGTPEGGLTYTTALGVPRSKTKQPKSRFQPFVRWATDGDPDHTGRFNKLAAAVDAWVALGDERPEPTPLNGVFGTSPFDHWLSDEGGYTNIAERHKKDASAEESRRPQWVWVSRIYETEGEQVYATAESTTRDVTHGGHPDYVRQEPATNFDLQDAMVSGGQYFSENGDGSIRRVAGEPLPPLPEPEEP